MMHGHMNLKLKFCLIIASVLGKLKKSLKNSSSFRWASYVCSKLFGAGDLSPVCRGLFINGANRCTGRSRGLNTW